MAEAGSGEEGKRAPPSRPVFRAVGRKQKIYEEVVEQIRAEIFAGRLALGERLPAERDLVEQFVVSRAVIREAIRALELTGFVTVKKGAGGGTFVAQDYERPIQDTLLQLLAGGEVRMRDLFEVRTVLEPYAAARAAELRTEEDLALLDGLVREADEEGASGTNIRPYNLRFHRLILGMSGNPVLRVMGETLLTILSKHIQEVESPERSLKVLEVHQEIAGAIFRRDAEAARRLVAADIQSLGVFFSQQKEEEQPARGTKRRRGVREIKA
jgi:GntR family transcriptional repressor for pyruvate dehydrogenase complex